MNAGSTHCNSFDERSDATVHEAAVVREDATADEGDTPDDGTADRDESDRRDRDGQVQRFEESRRGRILITLFLAVTLFSVLAVNMPASEIKNRVSTPVGVYLNAVGLDQGWGVFSPNPRPASIFVEALIQQRDGRVVVRPVPFQYGLAEYWDFRWQRWADSMAASPGNNLLWGPYCRWLAAQDRAAGGQPVRIALVNNTAATRPPGPGPEREPWTRNEFFAIGVGS